jgi:hypothetical protein
MEHVVRSFEAFAERSGQRIVELQASGSGADVHVTAKFEKAETAADGLSFCVQTIASGGDLNALVSITDDGAIVENEGWATRLFLAAQNSWLSVMKWLLEHGADVHVGFPEPGLTPLHGAAIRGHHDAAVILLDAGARVDGRSTHGFTALYLAAAQNHRKICKLLLSRGASLDASTRDGRDAEAEARSDGHTATAEFLAAVRAAGGWRPYVAAQRKPYIDALLAIRQRLPALRDRGRAASASSVRAHERLFLETPDGVFGHVLTFWQSDRDP